MNKQRRKDLIEVIDRINKAKSNLVDIKRELEYIENEEEEAYDAMGEGLQSTVRGMMSEDAIDNMEEAVDLLDDAIECVEAATV